MSRHWIAVACAEHARRGRALGIMQVCHGKGAPLRRLKAGDGVVYYSPTASLGGKDRLQAFTTIGHGHGRAYLSGRHGRRLSSVPPRRLLCGGAGCADPAPLLDRLELTRGKRNWGYAFRFGLVEIGAPDFAVIADAMGAKLD